MTNTDALAMASPGSRALRNAKYEKYCRLRASAQPRICAYREVGWRSKEHNVAYINACRLERRPEIQDRIGYLTRQDEHLVVEKRRRIEEQLWAIHEANIQDLYETYESAKTNKDGQLEVDADGNVLTVRKERPRLISELSPDLPSRSMM